MNDILLENRKDDFRGITNNLPIFYAHIIKYDNIIPQLSDWIGTIKERSKYIFKMKQDHPASYKAYSIKDNWNNINRNIWFILAKDGNSIDPEDYNLSCLGHFNTLDKIANLSYVQEFLKNRLKDEKLLTSIYK